MNASSNEDRKSVSTPPAIIRDPIEIAKREAANGLRQFDAVIDAIRRALGSDGRGSRLPGKPTIPDLLSERKAPYYAALEDADAACAEGRLDLASLETLLEGLLAAQLLSAVEEARGRGLPQ